MDGRRQAPPCNGLHQHFCIGVPAKHGPLRGKFLPNVAMVVDLAIENDHEAAIRRYHGLMATWRQVNNGEPAMAERDAAGLVGPYTPVVGTTMCQRVGHAGDCGLQLAPHPIGLIQQKSGYPAHRMTVEFSMRKHTP